MKLLIIYEPDVETAFDAQMVLDSIELSIGDTIPEINSYEIESNK